MDYRIIIDDKKYDYEIAENNKIMIEDEGLSKNSFKDDFNEICFKFMENGRKSNKLKTFVILDNGDDLVIGHAVCQMWNYTYLPNVLIDIFEQTGYIWGLYIKPTYRRKGYGKILTKVCHDYFREIGCKDVKLQATKVGAPLYKSMGYVVDNEMKYILQKKEEEKIA